MNSMDTDVPDESNGNTSNGLQLRLVSPCESGEGLPYAPENWPRPGDIWRWKVGQRVAASGHFLDRYLYPPKRLDLPKSETSSRSGLKSKLAVERYIRTAFPKADVEKFFNSFSWRVPCKNKRFKDGNALENVFSPAPIEDSDEDPDTQFDGVACKAGNRKCRSLVASEENPHLAIMPCDICCSEPNFCTECCCILCCKAITLEHGGYNYIKCEAVIDEGYICGHVAHVNCALRAYMAGTVGGSIGLDAEYCCRRCDAKTDLVPLVTRFLKTCETLDSHDDVEKVLNVGVCMLRGSQKASAKELLSTIESAIKKLKCGARLEDIWDVEGLDAWEGTFLSGYAIHLDGLDPIGVSPVREAIDDSKIQISLDLPSIVPIPSNLQVKKQELDDEIFQVLQALRKAQEIEYQIAEERLNAQKEYLNNLYEQLEAEKSVLLRRTSGMDANNLMTTVLKRMDQIKKQVMKLKEMEEIGKGFGRTPKAILEGHFDLQLEDSIKTGTP